MKSNLDNDIIRLPWSETLSRSFAYWYENIKHSLTLALPGLFLALYLFFTDSSVNKAEMGALVAIGYFLINIYSCYVFVAYSRFVMLREEPKKLNFSFGQKEFKYLLMVFLLEGIPSMLILGMIMFSSKHPELATSGIFSLSFLILFLSLFVAIIILSRCRLVYSAVSVDDAQMTLAKSFSVTKGNANKIFWGAFLINLFEMILLLLPQYLDKNLSLTVVSNILVLFVTFMIVSLRASFYAHAYQYFTYFSKKRLEDDEARALSKLEEKEHQRME